MSVDSNSREPTVRAMHKKVPLPAGDSDSNDGDKVGQRDGGSAVCGHPLKRNCIVP